MIDIAKLLEHHNITFHAPYMLLVYCILLQLILVIIVIYKIYKTDCTQELLFINLHFTKNTDGLMLMDHYNNLKIFVNF